MFPIRRDPVHAADNESDSRIVPFDMCWSEDNALDEHLSSDRLRYKGGVEALNRKC